MKASSLAVSGHGDQRVSEHFEQISLHVASETVGTEGEFFLDPSERHPTEARVRFSSRSHPDRTVGLRLDDAWLEAFFLMKSNVSILRLDDYGDGDGIASAAPRVQATAPSHSGVNNVAAPPGS